MMQTNFGTKTLFRKKVSLENESGRGTVGKADSSEKKGKNG